MSRSLFTIGASQTFEIRHQCVSTKTGNGFGVASGFGVDEVYTQVRIWKVN